MNNYVGSKMSIEQLFEKKITIGALKEFIKNLPDDGIVLARNPYVDGELCKARSIKFENNELTIDYSAWC